MRVLWFTNNRLPAVSARIGEEATWLGGWMESLRLALSGADGVELGIASLCTEPYDPFTQEGTTYINILQPRPASGMAAALEGWRHPIAFPGAVERCLEAARLFEPDLIHVHGSEGFFGLVGGRTPAPVLLSLQGILSACARAYLAGLTTGEIARRVMSAEFLKGRGLIHDRWRLRKAADREQLILISATAFTGRTSWDREISSKAAPDRPYYHCDRVLRAPFYEGRWRGNGSQKIIYCTSGEAPYKGLECLIRAVAILARAGRRDAHLRVAGLRSSSEMLGILGRRAAALGVADKVFWLGPIDARGVVGELEAASVFVMPSHIENNANGLCEAMLVGAPCIASRTGGVPSVLREGEEGLLFPPGDARALAEAIAAILESPALGEKLGNAARATAQARHEPGAIAMKTIEIYEAFAPRSLPKERPAASILQTPRSLS